MDQDAPIQIISLDGPRSPNKNENQVPTMNTEHDLATENDMIPRNKIIRELITDFNKKKLIKKKKPSVWRNEAVWGI